MLGRSCSSTHLHWQYWIPRLNSEHIHYALHLVTRNRNLQSPRMLQSACKLTLLVTSPFALRPARRLVMAVQAINVPESNRYLRRARLHTTQAVDIGWSRLQRSNSGRHITSHQRVYPTSNLNGQVDLYATYHTAYLSATRNPRSNLTYRQPDGVSARTWTVNL